MIIEAELAKICRVILEVLDKHLIPLVTTGEPSITRCKKGDRHRYVAEFAKGDKQKVSADNSLDACKCTSDMAITELLPTLPIHLGLALHFLVFNCESLNSPEHACHLAKQAFDDAIAEVDTLLEKTDYALYMYRKDLYVWSLDECATERA
ncbi:14-3-3 domain containing protein [Lactarius tabidus]